MPSLSDASEKHHPEIQFLWDCLPNDTKTPAPGILHSENKKTNPCPSKGGRGTQIIHEGSWESHLQPGRRILLPGCLCLQLHSHGGRGAVPRKMLSCLGTNPGGKGTGRQINPGEGGMAQLRIPNKSWGGNGTAQETK